MMNTDDDIDPFLNIGRFSILVGFLIGASGIALVTWAARYQQSLLWSTIGQIGLALLTAGLIEVVIFTGISKIKDRLTRDAREMTAIMKRLDEDRTRSHERLAELGKQIDSIDRKRHTIKVECNLELILIKLEAIHRAADPKYRELMERLEKERNANRTGEGASHRERRCDAL